MAQFDYYPQRDAPGYLLDCQTDLMTGYDTRFVVPLMPIDEAPAAARHLNPVFEIDGEQFVMTTQFAGTVPESELHDVVGSLSTQRYAVLGAIDFLITGV